MVTIRYIALRLGTTPSSTAPRQVPPFRDGLHNSGACHQRLVPAAASLTGRHHVSWNLGSGGSITDWPPSCELEPGLRPPTPNPDP